MLTKFIRPDFQFSDERGSLVQLVHQGWNQVNYITSAKGVVRGDHYHKINMEAFYVVDGMFKLNLRHCDSQIEESYDMKTGDFFIIFPNIIHSFYFKNYTSLVSMYDKGVELPNGEKDIWK